MLRDHKESPTSHDLSNLPATPSASPLACPKSGSTVALFCLVSAGATTALRCGSIGSEEGPDAVVEGVEVVAVVEVSGLKLRKGDGATKGR